MILYPSSWQDMRYDIILPRFRIFKCNQLSRAATKIPVEVGEKLMQIWIALYILICAFEVQKLSKVMFSWSKMNAKVRDLIFKHLKSATGTISCSKYILVHPQGTLACDHIFWGSWKVDIDSGSLVNNLQLSSSWSNRFITWFLFLFNWEHWEQKMLLQGAEILLQTRFPLLPVD